MGCKTNKCCGGCKHTYCGKNVDCLEVKKGDDSDDILNRLAREVCTLKSLIIEYDIGCDLEVTISGNTEAVAVGAEGNVTYNWHFKDNTDQELNTDFQINNSNTSTPTIVNNNPILTGVYKLIEVKVEDEKGCVATDQKLIYIKGE